MLIETNFYTNAKPFMQYFKIKHMKLLTILILIFPILIFGQNCDDCNIDPYIVSNSGCSVRLTQIKQKDVETYKIYCVEKEAYNISSYIHINDSDSLEKLLIQKYPDHFKINETGFDFIDNQGEKIEIRNIKAVYDIKDKQEYKITTIIGKYLVVYISGYEWWNYRLIDTENFVQYILPGPPIFINSELLYAYTNCYGSGEIKFIDTEKNKDVSLSFENSIYNVAYSNGSMGTLMELKNRKCKDTIYLNVKMR